jgi:hypothetical protein
MNLSARIARLESELASRRAPPFMPACDFARWVAERLGEPFNPSAAELRAYAETDREELAKLAERNTR